MQGFAFQKKYGLKFRSAESFVQSLHWQCILLLSGGVSLFLQQRPQRVHQLGGTQCGNSDLLRCWHWSWQDVVHLHWTSDRLGSYTHMKIPITIEHFHGKIPRRPRLRKRRLHSEFAFFQSLSWLLLMIIFNNYMAHFLKNNNQMRITRTRLLCEMQANSFWAEFLRIIFKFRKRQKI